MTFDARWFVLSIAVGCTRPSAPNSRELAVSVRCVTVGPEAFDEQLTLPGRVEPLPGADLAVASQVSGRIAELAAHEGQRVARGDTIAVVDDASSRDALHQAQATLAQVRAADANARAALDRVGALVARGIAAKQELDDARTRAETERQGVRSAEAAVDAAQRTLSRVAVKATLAGVVTHVWRGPGSLVDGTSATPIVQLTGTGGADFVVAATARELGALVPGQLARVELDDNDGGREGRVRVLSSVVDPATGLGAARITLDELDARVLMGAYGRARVSTQHRDGVLAIPLEAVRGALADGAEVVVCGNGKAELRPVRLGYRSPRFIEVISGVRTGERVAIDHVMGLVTGTAIEVTD
jgi:RND family efflux transporter MFP subunit